MAKPCRGCRQPKKEKPPKPPKPPKERLPAVLMIAEDTEGTRLWHWLYVGTLTCVQTFERYAQVNMPGANVKELTDLRDRLNKLLEKYESPTTKEQG